MGKQVVSIVGARPQFIKAAVVTRALQRVSDVRHTVIHTGQHYDANMSSVFFEELEIPNPDVNLGIGAGLQGAQTGRMLEAIERILQEPRSSMVVVYGDTQQHIGGRACRGQAPYSTGPRGSRTQVFQPSNAGRDQSGGHGPCSGLIVRADTSGGGESHKGRIFGKANPSRRGRHV